MIRSLRYLLTSTALACIMATSIAKAEPAVNENGIRELAPAPEVGVHPRVWFTAEEMGDVQRRIETTQFGQTVIQPMMEKFTSNFIEQTKQLREWDGQEPTADLVKQHFVGNEGRQQEAGMAALKALFEDDAELKKVCINWAVNYSKLLVASKKLTPDASFWAPKNELGSDWGLGHQNYVLGLAFVYDFLYNDMDDAERRAVRSAIAEAIRDRRAHGLGWPKTKQFSNHSPLHANLGCIALAIEGEEGYQPEMYDLWVDLMRDWISVAISQGGANHEDEYIYYALRGGMPFLIAAYKRGDDLLSMPNFRNTYRWQAQWEPTVGDLGNYQTFFVSSKFMYPEDPIVNMLWRRRAGADYDNRMNWQSAVDSALFCMDYDGDADDAADVGQLGLEKMIHDPRRGVMIARNGFGPNDLQFRFSARPDTMLVGHAAADSGSFSLNALGRNWVFNNVGDKDFSFDSADFSLVHINGEAEGMKPPTVKTTRVEDTPSAATISADLTYAYNWTWHYYWVMPKESADGQITGLPGEPYELEKEDPYELGWPAEEDFMPHDISHQPDLGFIGIYQYKKRHNEVDHASRTAVTVRGEHPYVLIVDDVKKDDQQHLYEWLLQVAPDLEIAYLHHKDIVLKESSEPAHQGSARTAPGAKRMLVRVLQPYEELPETQAQFYNRPNFIIDARLETHQYGLHNRKDRAQIHSRLGKRLVVPHRGTSGDFVTLLYPYQTTLPVDDQSQLVAWNDNPAGAPMPTTTWSEDGNQLVVEFDGQRDVFTFATQQDGHRKVTHQRDGASR